MADEKPVHIPRNNYPDLTSPEVPSFPRGDFDSGDEDSVHLLDYWHVLMARKWTVLAIFATVVIITSIVTFKQTPIYRASTTLQIDRESSNVLGDLKDVYQFEAATDDTLQTQYKVLEARTLARRVVQDLDLDKEPEFQPEEQGILGSYVNWFRELLATDSIPLDEPDVLRPYIDAYTGRISVTPVLRARLVRVSFESKSPKLAAKIINAHARRYIDQNFEFKYAATQDAADFLKVKVNGLKSDLEKAEDRVQQYSRDKNILVTEEGQNAATEKLRQLQSEYTKAQTDLFTRQSYYDLVQANDVDALPQVASHPRITELTGKLIDLQKQDQELAVKYGAEWQARRTIQSQITQFQSALASEKDKIVRTIKSEFTAASSTEAQLAAALAAQRILVENTNQDFVQYNIYKGDADSTKALYDSLLKRLNEAQVSASLKASNIRIVDPAEVPQRPVKPRKTLNLLLGMLMGTVLGIGFAFFQEYLDNSIKSPDDVARYLRLPTLGTIPNLQSLSDGQSYGYGYGQGKKTKEVALGEKPALEFITHGAPSSLMAEAYRSMRTSLLLSSADHAPRVILVTSAVPSEGKTVTAINTAISLTQTGSRVVLIDADMRKPRVHSVFALGNALGLSSFLTGAASLKDVIHETAIPNLFVLPCGIIPPNPGELILSSRFSQLLTVLRQYFDYIVIDSPPVANVSDARVLASHADAATLVVKAFSTSRHLAQRATDYLRESRIRNLGVILNDLDVHARTGYYSYYSGRYYYPSNYQAKPPGDS